MFYYIEPEIAGGFGAGTVMDTSRHPPTVINLEYQLDGWLGDEVLELFPCFVLTEAVAMEITKLSLSGFSLDSVEVYKSEDFDELAPLIVLPKFFWLKVHGAAGVSDFGIAKDYRLVVSEKAKSALSKYQLKNADFESYVG